MEKQRDRAFSRLEVIGQERDGGGGGSILFLTDQTTESTTHGRLGAQYTAKIPGSF